ncbi:hypothetical protein [Rhodococcus sp. ARC_M6]|uniref:hypothetical protein n=1 Tax=Rhodococcus sp. ARC_M6 TaxID=2928852 RepID=UPI001FB389A6|nr:hypothetical protein [Rhodococcus sp. ARC_M6]MCJ0904620.1 hypothetical protein [Rhodococcus sp. ARC_M6]
MGGILNGSDAEFEFGGDVGDVVVIGGVVVGGVVGGTVLVGAGIVVGVFPVLPPRDPDGYACTGEIKVAMATKRQSNPIK